MFFADGVIFAEGQAERILVPHFIRHHFPSLSRRYITFLDLGGSHAHRFKELIDELGLATLVIADLDAVVGVKIADKDGHEVTRWKAAKPQCGAKQKTSNPVLKSWHPAKDTIDDLIALKSDEHESSSTDGYRLYVAYQKPVGVALSDGSTEDIIPRTFEDALIFENLTALSAVTGSRISDQINTIVGGGLSGEELADELFQLLKSAEKAAFALDCLMLADAKSIKPPRYIHDGLKWIEEAIGSEIAENELKAASA